VSFLSLIYMLREGVLLFPGSGHICYEELCDFRLAVYLYHPCSWIIYDERRDTYESSTYTYLLHLYLFFTNALPTSSPQDT
jgi:hypothetical protein